MNLSLTHERILSASVLCVLIGGITLCLAMHFPLYIGLALGFVASALYARLHGHRLPQIGKAALSGMKMMTQVGLALTLIAMVVALWLTNGTIPTLTTLAGSFVKSSNIVWVSFIAAALLSLIIGSAVATWSILGLPLLALAPPSFVPVVAGALVSGALFGDRSSPMSTSVVLMSTVTRVPYKQALVQMLKTSILPFLVTGCLYFAFNQVRFTSLSRPESHMGAPAAANLWFLIPPALVIALALCRLKLLYNLLAAYVLAAVIQLVLHGSVGQTFHQTLFGASLAMHGHKEIMGGLVPILPSILLIFIAGAFQGVTNLGGSVAKLTDVLFANAVSRLRFVSTVFATCFVFSLIMGTQMLTLLMCGNTLNGEYEKRGLRKETLLQIVGDAPELIPPLVPWNLLGLQAYTILSVGTLTFLPYAWFIYVTLFQSVILLWQALRPEPFMHSRVTWL